MRRSLLWLSIVCAVATHAQAQDSTVINIDETVTGNQEQPKVLYIVPWKTAADSFDFEQSITQRTTGSVFQHLERDELKRQLEYMQAQTTTDSATDSQ